VKLENLAAGELLSWARETYAGEFAIATSFQKEGMVIVDQACGSGGRCRVFTLDTGRLPDETHQMIETVRVRYGISVEVVAPLQQEVEAMVSAHGRDLFYQSTDLRGLCCDVRKVRPFQRKLAELKAWASGLRREQSKTRAGVRKVEEVDGRIRISPLADWTSEQVDRYIRDRGVPLHPLYLRGYTSIGCAPCTRAVAAGEDERAGRWWWEAETRKECGIHFAANGTAERDA
jgi:phosphoadenylyl-sulfate reductase (thioredoxin)